MALNVLIADDEYFIRRRLAKIIDWEDMRLCFAGEVENGIQAIERLSKGDIDILLLDIEMPGQSGIAVAEYLFEHKLTAKVIILSGYNNFEYARQALRFQVFDYLLKPVERDSLSTVLQKCTAQIMEERAERHERECYNNYLRRDTISHALQSGVTTSKLYGDYPELASYSHICLVGIFCSEDLEKTAEKVIQISMCTQAEIFRESDTSAIIMMFFESFGSINNLLLEFLDDFSGRLFLSLSEKTDTELSERYQMVSTSLIRRFFYTSKKLIVVDSDDVFDNIRDKFMSIRKNLVLCLNTGDINSFCSFIDNLFSNIGKTENPHYLNLVLTELVLTFQVHFSDRVQLPDSVPSYVGTILEEENDMMSLCETVKNLGLRCIGDGPQTPSDSLLIGRLRARMDEMYIDESFSVAQLAEEFSHNSAYLGTVFKKVTGVSVVQYITSKRMEKAHTLLQEQLLKITQVAEMVGYSDVFYFSKRFKKYYGYPPSEIAKLRV